MLHPIDRERYGVPATQAERGEAGSEVAIAKNISDRGMLLASYKKLVVGAPVKLALHVRPEDTVPREISGTIVRLVPNDEDPEGMWRYKMAVEFDDPDPTVLERVDRGGEP